MRARSVLLAVMLAACGSRAARVETTTSVVIVETAPHASAMGPQSGPQSNPVVTALPAHTLWQGRYLCAQGPTGLTLTLDLAGGRASGVFDFFAVPENPTVPTGRYLVVGNALVRSDGALDVALAPDRWIAQPPGYVMVGMVGSIDAGGRMLRGSIDHPTCTGVELYRQ